MCSILGNSRKPDIYFRRGGRIDITAKVSEALDLQPGDIIDIWNEHEEYFLYVLHRADNIRGNHIAVCQQVNPRNRYIRVYCIKLCNFMRSLCGGNEVHLPVGESVQLPNIGTAIPLITRNNLYV